MKNQWSEPKGQTGVFQKFYCLFLLPASGGILQYSIASFDIQHYDLFGYDLWTIMGEQKTLARYRPVVPVHPRAL